MATSKTDKSRKDKKEAFKQAQKAKHAEQSAKRERGPKTRLVPDVEWQSNENLDLRGDIADAIQSNLAVAYQSLQRAGQAFQVLLNQNLKSGKAKLTYTWDNGEKPTADEVKEYEAQIKALQDLQQQQLKQAEQGIQQEAAEKESAKETSSGLVTPNGAPLTEENLEKEKSGIIVP